MGDKFDDRNIPIKVPNLSEVTTISNGFGQHTIVKDSNDIIWSFGNNFEGQLGIGPLKNRKSPSAMDPKHSDINRNQIKSRAKSVR